MELRLTVADKCFRKERPVSQYSSHSNDSHSLEARMAEVSLILHGLQVTIRTKPQVLITTSQNPLSTGYLEGDNLYIYTHKSILTHMKGLLIGLFVFAFAAAGSAQSTRDVSKMTKDAKSEVTAKQDKQDKQIKDALMKDKDLQAQTVDYMMENEDTQKQVAKLAEKADGDKKLVMMNILKNKKLAQAAIEYVKSNPELLKKAMSVVGM